MDAERHMFKSGVKYHYQLIKCRFSKGRHFSEDLKIAIDRTMADFHTSVQTSANILMKISGRMNEISSDQTKLYPVGYNVLIYPSG